MKFKKVLNTFVLTTIATSMLSTSVFALNFNDVPSTYWGYNAIDSVSDKGLMLGDLNGNFRPNAYIDRFETSIVIARLLGYKTTGATDAEKAYYDQCYNNNASIITQYDTKFNKWDSTANREIAFLMEKGVLTVNDLNQFVILGLDGSESKGVSTKEDICLYLVRGLGAVDKANTMTYTNLFNDDADISSSKRGSVYYLRSLGIVSGDNNNNFNPKSAVRRAEMATMIDKTYAQMYGTTTNNNNNTNTNTNNNNNNNSNTVTSVSTVTGTIQTVYDNLDTISVLTSGGQTAIYVIDDSCAVTIDGYGRTKADLKEGMYCVFVVEDNKIVKNINATSNTTTNNNNNNNTGSTTGTVTNNSDLYGTVSSVDSLKNTISISTKTISPKNEIITTVTTYNVTNGTPIVKGSKAIQLSDIKAGDIVTCDVSGTYVSNIIVEEQNLEFDGTITGKGIDPSTNKPYFTVLPEDSETELKLFVNSDTDMYRSGDRVSSWNSIKVGDTASINSTLGVIDQIVADGEKEYKTGYVKNVYYSKYNGYITLTNADKSEEFKYYLDPTISDAYDLKVGQKVKLTLDSQEVRTISYLEDPANETLTGTVDAFKQDYIVVIDDTFAEVKVYYDDDTTFINSKTGAIIDVGDVDYDDEVIVVYESDSNVAKTITIIK